MSARLRSGSAGHGSSKEALASIFSDWPEAVRNLAAPEPRFSAPAVPYLREELQDEEEAELARPEDAGPVNLATAAKDLSRDLTGLKEAISFYKSGALAEGDSAAKTATDKTVQTALEWIAIRTFPRQTGFERIQAFLTAHPAWPARDWLRNFSEEALFGDHKSAALIKTYFSTSEPQTPAGKLALARALKDDGKTEQAAALVRSVWREADLNAALETKIKTDFGDLLLKADHKYRADRLLYKEQVAGAMRAAALAGPDVTALAKARAAVINDAPSDRLFAAVPSPLRADPGYKFSMIQKLRRAEKTSEAVAAMLSAPRDPIVLVNGDEWWVERRLLARKLLDRGDAKTAYKLCAEHSAATREMKLEAEFHAGWIALRFLDDPARAATHFDTLAKLAETPMSKARAAYWQGRAAAAAAKADAATAFYQQAAVQPATYYGQLAREKLGLSTAPIRMPSTAATGDARDRVHQGPGDSLRCRREKPRQSACCRGGAPYWRPGANRGVGERRRQATGRACFADHRQNRQPARRGSRRTGVSDLWRPRVSAVAEFGGPVRCLFDRSSGKRVRGQRNIRGRRQGPDADD